MLSLDQPGIYTDVATADYHLDPAPRPSLSQSIAKLLLDRSPLHAWHAHPRLNPDHRPDNDTKYDVGNIAHTLMLGRGKEIVVLDYDDWRTKAAKEERETAAQIGKLAVLGKHHALASRMVEAAREQLALRNLDYLFADWGNAEVCLLWEENDVWLRQLVDWYSPRTSIVADYKTTDLSVAPQNLGRLMMSAGWHIQAAMAERGLDVLEPSTAGRLQYLFVAQETEPPYCLSVVQIGEAALTLGRKQIDMAVARWRECMATNRWPGYPAHVQHPEIPAWAEAQILERELDQAENILIAG